MPLKMRNDNVLLEYEAPPETTESQLIQLVNTAPKVEVKLYPAKVLAVGPGHWLEYKSRPERADDRGEVKCPKLARRFLATVVQPGDRVLIGGLAGDSVRGAEAGQQRIVRETEIEAIVGEGVRVNG